MLGRLVLGYLLIEIEMVAFFSSVDQQYAKTNILAKITTTCNSIFNTTLYPHSLRCATTSFTLFSNASIIFSATFGAAAALKAPYRGLAN